MENAPVDGPGASVVQRPCVDQRPGTRQQVAPQRRSFDRGAGQVADPALARDDRPRVEAEDVRLAYRSMGV